MGRFYQSTPGIFVDDNIYQAPWELSQQVIENADARTDQMITESELIRGAVDTLQHLNFDAENERVKEIQNKYQTIVDDLSTQIHKNPLKYNKFAPQIKKVQRDLLNDRASGDWFAIEQRYKDYQQWSEENKEIKESNPTLYNQLNKHWYDDIVTRGTDNPNARFQGQRIIDKPDLIEGYRQHFENIKASSTETKDGMYRIKNEWVSEDEVANIAWNTLISDKDYQGFVNQQGRTLGLPGYLDEKGNPLNAFQLQDGQGNNITFEDFKKLTPAEQKKASRVLNVNNAFYSDLASVTDTYSFNKGSIKEDAFEKMKFKGAIDSNLETQKQGNKGQLEQLKHLNRLQLEAAKDKGDMETMKLKYELQGEQDRNKFKQKLELEAADGSKKSENILNIITAKETIGALGNPSTSIDSDYNLIETRKEAGEVVNNDGQDYIFATPGTTEYAALQRRTNATEAAKQAQGNETIVLSNGTEIQGNEYFDWLGDRRHSEDLAKEFLEKKAGIIQRSSLDASSAGQQADETRWLPGWTKSDMANDWDKVYELGNKYEEERNKWYENYNTSSTQVNLQPVNDVEVSRSMMSEIKNNPQNFYLTDTDGEIPKNMRSKMGNIELDAQLFVTSANAHNEMGMKVTIGEEDYFVFPNNGNNAAINLMSNMSMMGVKQDSQYFTEMSNRTSTALLHDLSQAGQNSKGTKSIVTKLNGIQLSLELVGDEVHLRQPDQALTSPPVKTFPNMREFVKRFYKTKNSKIKETK